MCSNDSTMERHLSLEACELSPEKYCILDLAKQEYASHLQEGTGLVPSLQVPASYVSADNDHVRIKETGSEAGSEAERFRDAQKS